MLRTGSHTCFHSHLPGSKRTRRPQATDPGSLNYRLAECGNGSPFRRKPPAPPAITVKDFTSAMIPCSLAAGVEALHSATYRLILQFMAAPSQDVHQVV